MSQLDNYCHWCGYTQGQRPTRQLIGFGGYTICNVCITRNPRTVAPKKKTA